MKNFLLTTALVTTLFVTMVPVANAANWEGWQVRGRIIGFYPEDDSATSIGGNVEPSNIVVPELDITYFWSAHWATELILATTPHDMKAYNLTGLGNQDLGNVWLLPPTLTMQYHFMPEQTIQPYIGAGVNYTIFYNEDDAGTGAVTSIDYDNAFGVAAQAGFDVKMDDHWYFNVDLKKVWLNTDVTINGGAVTADVDLDPWVFGLGLGYRF